MYYIFICPVHCQRLSYSHSVLGNFHSNRADVLIWHEHKHGEHKGQKFGSPHPQCQTDLSHTFSHTSGPSRISITLRILGCISPNGLCLNASSSSSSSRTITKGRVILWPGRSPQAINLKPSRSRCSTTTMTIAISTLEGLTMVATFGRLILKPLMK